ncbi:Wadjet anti-phage system protein JetA family protein [Parvibaculum sp.]|uniref:Wadjet anti-phage system protein JetA family protein n=1 Tax=Parvibaculum sp. TaxID=2024848 RepID=UPI0025D65AA4|nr:Wadjet anti-phage system protein JetA family protein [Parvibaculum sp.]
MLLFDQLPLEIFQPLAHGNKLLFAKVLEDLYRRFFEEQDAPRRAEVEHAIYQTLTENLDLWVDEEETLLGFDDLKVAGSGRRLRRRKRKGDGSSGTDLAMARSRHIYTRLVNCGWLEEQEQGVQILVEMPFAPTLLLTRLLMLKDGISLKVGGVVAAAKSSLEAAVANPQESGLAVIQAARNIEEFVTTLRAIQSSLRNVEKSFLERASRDQGVELLIEGFVEGLLLKDFKLIYEGTHPYAHRGQIIRLTDDILDDEDRLRELAATYQVAGEAGSSSGAINRVREDIDKIRMGLSRMEDGFSRIRNFKWRLERRLTDAVRYMERDIGASATRAVRLVQALDRLGDRDDCPGLMRPLEIPYGKERLVRPKIRKQRIAPQAIAVPTEDPLDAFRARMEAQHLQMGTVTRADVREFLRRRVARGEATDGRLLVVKEPKDFFVMMHLIHSAHHIGEGYEDGDPVGLLSAEYEVIAMDPSSPDGWIENEWLRAPNFKIVDLGDANGTANS